LNTQTQELQRTVLYDTHLKLNAKMTSFANYSMPLQYSSVKEEVAHVRQGAGVFDVSHMGEFFVTGSEAKDFLQNIISNDLATLPLGKAQYNLLLNDEGNALDDIIVYFLEENFYMICVNASNLDKDWSWLSEKLSQFKKDGLLQNVQLFNKSEQMALLAVQGPAAISLVEKYFKTNLISLLPNYGVLKLDSGNYLITEKVIPTIIATTGYTGEKGVEIFCDKTVAVKIFNDLLDLGVAPCGFVARDVLRIEAGFPLYGHEINEATDPFEARLTWALKLSKNENFCGKSALMKKYHLSSDQLDSKSLRAITSKRRLEKFIVQGAIPREGAEIYSKKSSTDQPLYEKVGKVTSGTFSPTANYGICMAMLEGELPFNLQELYLEVRGKFHPIQHTLSFLKK